MSMYLPNPALQPTGAEAAEFIDVPPMHERPAFRAAPVPVPLDLQARLDITRWAQEYISGLVDARNGTSDDVRSIIHALHDRLANHADLVGLVDEA
jgi:hypothetical protein